MAPHARGGCNSRHACPAEMLKELASAMHERNERACICIDLKSFYASVECIERGLDPFKDNLVVADPTRTEKTICLAITPAMKALGVRNRCRVFEIPPGIEYVKARPRMRLYMQRSAEIYAIYLRYVSPEDVHVYSIDEVFIEATPYLSLYDTDARTFATTLMNAVFEETGICATAGVGTNLFLAKVALDITAKHAPDNIGYLDEDSFKRDIWFHTPITDIWNIGPGIARRLGKYGVRDLAGVAAMDPKTLYREFGKNAEFLIDHAWGQEPCTIAEIQAYEPSAHSLVNGQVLPCDYTFDEARMVMREMAESSILELVEKRLATDHISLYIGYARNAASPDDDLSLADVSSNCRFDVGESARTNNARTESTEHSDDDHAKENARPKMFDGGHGLRPAHGGRLGEHTGGTRKLDRCTNSRRYLIARLEELFDETTLHDVAIRRVNVGFGNLVPEESTMPTLFDDVEADEQERRLQQALVAVRGKFGKNALLKAASLQEKATARERNEQVGGHHA
ncbi:MAG: DNA repair protein [Eggerthellaceae bacterium]|nr:DNA repair protein [Eggerthellaceae bacterium]